MKTINIYAPCDGEVENITNLNDGVFSEKMLGDGFFIKPLSSVFYSPIEEGWISNIFETKHAIHFQINDGPALLMHIGLDTVNLKGEPFNVFVKEKQSVNLDTKICEVDLNFIISKSLNTSTPLVFESEESKYSFTMIKSGSVKQGEKIAELKLNLSEGSLIKNKETKNKYSDSAKQILKLCGDIHNIKKAYNCMTRFRVILNDKGIVNTDEIKKISIVKGINWNGSELQIIIGGDAYKVKEEFQLLYDGGEKNTISKSSANKSSFKEKILGFISGIIIPVLPIMITAGLLKAVQAIFEQTGLIQKVSLNIKPGEIAYVLTNYDLFTGVVYSVANIGLAFLGVAFVVSTVSYFKGNIFIGLFIGLTLMNPYLTGGLNWVLFRIGAVDIKVQSYGSSIIPTVTAGVLYIFLDRWIKKWMPSTVDIIFRPFIAYLLTVVPILFIIGPALGIVESGIYYIMTWIGTIPFGLGAGIFSFAWQFLVITGLHTAINGFVNMSIANNQPTVLGLCFTLTVFAQMGAGIGMVLKTRNSNSKKTIIAAIPATWFGITEPILYGSTLPKVKPFVMGCVGAGIGGVFVGITNLTSYTVSAGGIFAILRVIEGGWIEICLYMLSWVITIVSSVILTMLVYREKEDELKETKKINKQILSLMKLLDINNESNSYIEVKNILTSMEELIESNKNSLFIKYDKMMALSQKLELHLRSIEEKQLNKLSSLNYKIDKYQKKVNVKKIKMLTLKQKELTDAFNNKKLIGKSELLNSELKLLQEKREKIQLMYLEKSERMLQKINETLKHPLFPEVNNLYFNAIYSCEISYEIVEKQSFLQKIRDFAIKKTL